MLVNASEWRTPGRIAALVTIPLVVAAIIAVGIFLWFRRRNKLRRSSIRTFMDQSAPHEPTIGRPLDVRHMKLPPALNDMMLAAPNAPTRCYSSLAPATPPPPPTPPIRPPPQSQRTTPPPRDPFLAPLADPFRGPPSKTPSPPPSANPFQDVGEITVALSRADSRKASKGNAPASLPAGPKNRPPLPPLRKPSTVRRMDSTAALSAISEMSVVGTPVEPKPNTQAAFQRAYHDLRSEVNAGGATGASSMYSTAEYDMDWETVQQGLRDIQLPPKRV